MVSESYLKRSLAVVYVDDDLRVELVCVLANLY
jgi:hypothetical protein